MSDIKKETKSYEEQLINEFGALRKEEVKEFIDDLDEILERSEDAFISLLRIKKEILTFQIRKNIV